MSHDVLFLAPGLANAFFLPSSIGSDRRVSSATRLIAARASHINDR
jgi:hypothetical protein